MPWCTEYVRVLVREGTPNQATVGLWARALEAQGTKIILLLASSLDLRRTALSASHRHDRVTGFEVGERSQKAKGGPLPHLNCPCVP